MSVHDPADRADTVAYLRDLTEQVERGEVSGLLVAVHPAPGVALGQEGYYATLGPESDALVSQRLLATTHRWLTALHHATAEVMAEQEKGRVGP